MHASYGAPARVVEIRDLEKSSPDSDEVLVRVSAASVNIADWYDVTGRPWIARGSTGLRGPKETRIGVDYAGVVEAVGSEVTEFELGDEVFAQLSRVVRGAVDQGRLAPPKKWHTHEVHAR